MLRSVCLCGTLCQILQESSVPWLSWSTGGPELLTLDARSPPRVGWRLALREAAFTRTPARAGGRPGRRCWPTLAPLLRGEQSVACLCDFAGTLSGTAVPVRGKAVGIPVAGLPRCPLPAAGAAEALSSFAEDSGPSLSLLFQLHSQIWYRNLFRNAEACLIM